MYCTSCGSKLPEDARFCDKCGTSVENGAAKDQHPEINEIPKASTEHTKTGNPGRDWAETGVAAFQELSGQVNSAADKLGLDEWQKIICMISAGSLLLFIICMTGTLESWLSVISGAMLLLFCSRKKQFESTEMAVTMTIFIMRFVSVDIRRLLGEYISYSVSGILMRFVLYGLVVVYWLALTGRSDRKEQGTAWVLVLSGVTALYEAADTFLSFRYGFRSALFSLGMTGFFACYVLLISREQKMADYINSIFGKKILNHLQPSDQIRPAPGSPAPESPQPEPPENPEVSASDTPSDQNTQENTSPNHPARFCLSCGNRLPSVGAFCEHCGAKIEGR